MLKVCFFSPRFPFVHVTYCVVVLIIYTDVCVCACACNETAPYFYFVLLCVCTFIYLERWLCGKQPALSQTSCPHCPPRFCWTLVPSGFLHPVWMAVHLEMQLVSSSFLGQSSSCFQMKGAVTVRNTPCRFGRAFDTREPCDSVIFFFNVLFYRQL